MAMTGYYENGVIVTDAKLMEKQKVIIVPLDKSAFGGLHKYADKNKIALEKEAFENEMVKAFVPKKNNS